MSLTKSPRIPRRIFPGARIPSASGITSTPVSPTAGSTPRSFPVDTKYSGADDIYNILVEYIMEDLKTDTAFAKKIYRYLINAGTVTGRELCLALYSQNILAYDENEYRMLAAGGEEYAFQFIRQKISDIEITPAQLALDPCSGRLRRHRCKHRRGAGARDVPEL